MTKIKVKINAPAPSIEAIHQFKDFEGFLQQYRKYYSTAGIRDMLYNDRKKLVYIVIIILFLMLLLFVEDITKKDPAEGSKAPIEQVE